MLKNKKSLVLKEAVVLVLVAIIIIATWGFFTRVYAALVGERDDGSLANFESGLVPAISELLKDNRKMAYAQINYFLGEGRAVVGYNKVWNAEENLPILRLRIEKPNFCGDKACLCFFKSDKQAPISYKEPLKPCIKFDKVKYFIKDKTLGNEQSIMANVFYTQPLTDAFLHDEYIYLLLSGNTFKSKLIYIEKYTDSNGEVIFYIAPINDATRDKINKRKAYIDNLNKQ